jgi:hypothetical protein
MSSKQRVVADPAHGGARLEPVNDRSAASEAFEQGVHTGDNTDLAFHLLSSKRR